MSPNGRSGILFLHLSEDKRGFKAQGSLIPRREGEEQIASGIGTLI